MTGIRIAATCPEGRSGRGFLSDLSRGMAARLFRVFFSFMFLFGFSFQGAVQPWAVSRVHAADAEQPDHVGRVFHVTGEAIGSVGSEQGKPLQANDELKKGERIVTKAGAVAILKFRDGATLTVGPEGKVVLDEFVFNPASSETKNTVQVEKGAFRLTSGFKTKKSAVSLRTRTATVGVRGTVAEGFVDEHLPEFINLPKGLARMETAGGVIELTDGQYAASAAAANRPVDSQSLPQAIAAQGVGLLRAEIGDELPNGTPLTPEQMRADALANRMPVEQQISGGTDSVSDGFSFMSVFRSMVRWLVQWLRGWVASLGDWLDRLAGSLIRQALAASAEEAARSLSLLVKAAEVGILEPVVGSPTPQQLQAREAFQQEAQRVVPDAQAVLAAHQGNQRDQNRKNILESTQGVVQGAASVAKDGQEMAAIVKNAVDASPKGDGEVASIIVREAVSAKGVTDNANVASLVVQAAASADPGVAGMAAGAAVKGLPESLQAGAAAQVASAAVKAAPEAAATVASSVIQVMGAKVAGEVAAVVTLAAGASSAAMVAEAAAKAGGPESAASVAAAVTQVAGSAAAATVAGAVMASAGSDNALKVAAAVAQVAGSAAAASVAAAVAQKLDPAAAARVAAVVVQVAGAAAADAIVKAVAGSVGVSAEAFKQNVSQAAQSPEIAQAVKASVEIKEQARANGDRAREADDKADKAVAPAEQRQEGGKVEPAPSQPVVAPSPASGSTSTGPQGGASTSEVMPAVQLPQTPESRAMASAIASGTSVEVVIMQAQKSGEMNTSQIIAAAVAAGIDPASLTRAAISLGINPVEVASAAVAAGADSAQITGAAILAGGDPGTIAQAAIEAGGRAADVAGAAIASGGDAARIATAAMAMGGDVAEITRVAIQSGGSTGEVARALIAAGADTGAVMTGAMQVGGSDRVVAQTILSSGGDVGAVLAVAARGGMDVRDVAAAALSAGGGAGSIAAAAVRAGASVGEITSALIRAGGDVQSVVQGALQAGGQPYEVVVGATSAAPDQIRAIVDTAVQSGMDPGSAESAGAAGQQMESPLIDNGNVPSPS
ncbi:MAG: FecR domain-containing protein [Magnetococcales bacterium]|nr:FecR domain-containing protein [Magnetococcales bacterium]